MLLPVIYSVYPVDAAIIIIIPWRTFFSGSDFIDNHSFLEFSLLKFENDKKIIDVVTCN